MHSKKIINMRVDAPSCHQAANLICDWAEEGRGRYVCVSNVHMCMEAFDSSDFRAIVNGADLVVPDGKPLVWGLRYLGLKRASQVRGADLLLAICQEAESRRNPIGLYGGSKGSLRDFQLFLTKTFPALEIACAISPPFRPLTEEEDGQYGREIISTGARIIFAGIGCPKQEIWMAKHKDSFPCVMIGVGAVFDFFSGRKKEAPRWMQAVGLEWLFRLLSDPKRLWKRYAKHNPRFIWHFFRRHVIGRKAQ
jgi:N-acetylglucosaminyldiphosphoundecaprenol N-acetyl-beta-D-mannosaminyltransferase